MSKIRNPEVRALATKAEDFLSSHRWCGEIHDRQLAFAVAGVIGLFRFSFSPTESNVNDRLWVVVGDIPPAYLVLDNAKTWQEALDGYVYEMKRWVDAVRSGHSTDEVIPVNVPETAEYAIMLESRLQFIHKRFLEVSADALKSDA